MSEEQAIKAFDNIMIDESVKRGEPEKVENDLPNSYELTQLNAVNDDPTQLEGFIMEDSGIPLNMRLLQTDDNPDNMDNFAMEDVPFNAKLIHIGNEDDGELVMVDQKWGFLKNIVNIDRFFDSGVKAWDKMKNNVYNGEQTHI